MAANGNFRCCAWISTISTTHFLYLISQNTCFPSSGHCCLSFPVHEYSIFLGNRFLKHYVPWIDTLCFTTHFSPESSMLLWYWMNRNYAQKSIGRVLQTNKTIKPSWDIDTMFVICDQQRKIWDDYGIRGTLTNFINTILLYVQVQHLKLWVSSVHKLFAASPSLWCSLKKK